LALKRIPLRVISLHHVPFEGLGSMERLIAAGGHSLIEIEMWENPELPVITDFDLLLVMGGPMIVGDLDQYPWLAGEKDIITKSISGGKIVLGICLGAQLIAETLGAVVAKGKHREIGWFPITMNSEAKRTLIGSSLPDRFEAFHWHSDTFRNPDGAVPLGWSDACSDQGFIYNERVIGLQFHLETTQRTAAALIQNSPADLLDAGHFVQTWDAMTSREDRFNNINLHMAGIWEQIEKMNYN